MKFVNWALLLVVFALYVSPIRCDDVTESTETEEPITDSPPPAAEPDTGSPDSPSPALAETTTTTPDPEVKTPPSGGGGGGGGGDTGKPPVTEPPKASDIPPEANDTDILYMFETRTTVKYQPGNDTCYYPKLYEKGVDHEKHQLRRCRKLEDCIAERTGNYETPQTVQKRGPRNVDHVFCNKLEGDPRIHQCCRTEKEVKPYKIKEFGDCYKGGEHLCKKPAAGVNYGDRGVCMSGFGTPEAKEANYQGFCLQNPYYNFKEEGIKGWQIIGMVVSFSLFCIFGGIAIYFFIAYRSPNINKSRFKPKE